MKRIDTLMNMFPSMYRRQKQVNNLADVSIIGSTPQLIFYQRDVLGLLESGPLVVIADSIIGENDIEITITYNAGSTYDYTISSHSDVDTMYFIDIGPYQITNISYKAGTSKKGTDGDSLKFYNLTGNHAKILYVFNSMGTDITNIAYEFLRYVVMANARDDWLDQQALSWGIARTPEDTDASLIKRIISRSTPTDGTIQSVIDRVRTYLELSPDDAITVLESFEGNQWTLDESRLLKDGESELILEGEVQVQPMQFVMTISNYTGSLTEEEVENFLRDIINVGASPIVRFS